MNDDIDDAQTLRHAEPVIETKTFDLKAADTTLEENTFKGHPSVMGVIDRGSDLIFPGFFRKALKGFSQNGFIPQGHDWAGPPIAMPTLIEERGNVLYSEAVFHTTQAAQDVRTICRERLEKGLSVGLSVGFMTGPDGAAYFPNGQALMDYAKGAGCDLSLFDSKVASYKYGIRGLLPDGCEELFEYSVCNVPMNKPATMIAAKSLRSAGTGLEYGDYLELVAAQVKELVERTERRREVRLKQGRKLSANTALRLDDIYQSCETLKSLLEAIHAEQDEEMPSSAAADAAQAIQLSALAARAELVRLELSNLSLVI